MGNLSRDEKITSMQVQRNLREGFTPQEIICRPQCDKGQGCNGPYALRPEVRGEMPIMKTYIMG